MVNTREEMPVIFTPSDEPYLGRRDLQRLDELIVKCLSYNADIAPRTHELILSEPQQMACIVLPQALSLTLSIRELIRQGYLFGAHVLVRPLAERACIALYLYNYPADIDIWNRGWPHGEAPSLATMFDKIQRAGSSNLGLKGRDLTAPMNNLIHGKPESGRWNMTGLDGVRGGYAPSKLLSRPDLCDEVCMDAFLWASVTLAMMTQYFPANHQL